MSRRFWSLNKCKFNNILGHGKSHKIFLWKLSIIRALWQTPSLRHLANPTGLLVDYIARIRIFWAKYSKTLKHVVTYIFPEVGDGPEIWGSCNVKSGCFDETKVENLLFQLFSLCHGSYALKRFQIKIKWN